MELQEIYTTIQGEAPLNGAFCTVVRLAGCNLTCSYCDAPSKPSYTLSIEEIIQQVENNCMPTVLITGGEPLLQTEDVRSLGFQLIQKGFETVLETNGTLSLVGVSGYVNHMVMDIKLCDGPRCTYWENLHLLGPNDVVKFVYEDWDQLCQAFSIISWLPENFKPLLVFSPVHLNEPYAEKIALQSAEHPNLNIRLQVQMHKVLHLG